VSTASAAAYIITADAEALGDPEIIIMTRDEGMGAEVIERHELGQDESNLNETQMAARLANLGWRAPQDGWTLVEPGYWIVDVERMD
jgi:hypothetical protein